MNVTILGAGAYGLALSKMFLKNNCNITIWTALTDEYDMLVNDRVNKTALPDYRIDKSIKITMDTKEAIQSAKLVVIAVPVKFLRNTVIGIKKYYKNQHICIASKGIEQESCTFPYKMVYDIIKTNKISVISDGTFAVDMIKDIPLGLTVASKNTSSIKIVKNYLENEFLKIEVSNDIIGTEIWGSIKNVIAIGCGIIDGMGYPESTKSMFFTRCFNGINKLVYELNGNKSTSLTYAGIGDLYLTCNSSKSRNYTLGKIIGENKSKREIDKYIKETTIEGMYTLSSFYQLLNKRKIKVKIINILYEILYKKAEVKIIDDYLKK